MQHLELLCHQEGVEETHATQITARPIESGDETELYRIATRREQYGKRRIRLLGRQRRGDIEDGEHRDRMTDQLRDQRRLPVVPAFRPSVLNLDVSSFHVS
jgi:hypothetical protein